MENSLNKFFKQSMVDDLKDLQKGSVEDFPKVISGALSTEINGAVTEGTQ